ncbi:TRAP transporter small permease [Rhodovulum sp. DZ06]|uniref:TRAP transporter small permease n=1 Tax=Rhodovulum sp. DZ06 TaxID=3425126 RepID=UPI003D337F8F
MTPQAPASRLGRAIDSAEETLIAITIGAMTLITFANVVARFGFNDNILWALEMTSFLFAWLVLLGASYAVKKNAHLGVDALVNLFGPAGRRALGLLAGVLSVLYAALLLKGGWDFFAPFANLSPTSGRFIPTGFEDVRGQGWYESLDIDMPAFLNPLFSEWFNEGERYEKIPLLIPYAALPVGMALLLLRFVQATIRIWTGESLMLIASHEAEDAVEEASRNADKDEDGDDAPRKEA